MIIQIITNLYPLPWEPHRAAFNRQQFESLAQHHEVNLIVLVPWISALKNAARMRASSINNVNIRYLPYFYLPRIGRRLYSASALLSLLPGIFALIKRRPDCMLLSWAYPDAVAGMVLSRILKIPAVIKVHGSDINMHCAYPARARQVGWAMRHAAAVLSVSQDLKNKIMKLGIADNKIRVIYNGVDKKIFQPRDRCEVRNRLGVDVNRKIILFIGNLKFNKGCVDLTEAFVAIAQAHPLVDLYVIGNGDQKSTISRIAEKHALQNRVMLLGSLNHSKLGDWINASNLLALPSHNEGVPNVLLEAMSCGVPVVATRVGGIPEVVTEHAGILVDVRNTGALSAALVDGLEHAWKREQIVETMRKFTWENNTELTAELLHGAAFPD